MTTTVENPANGNGTALTERRETIPARQPLVVHDNGPLAHLFDTAKYEQLQRVAGMIASSGFTPDHLIVKNDAKATIANCFRVANQALRWGFDPFVVADESYSVRGKLGYQGKLVAAVVNSRAGLDGRLAYSFAGTGDSLTITVSGKFKGDTQPRTITLSVGQAKTENQMWKKDPEQKLVYSGVTKWARRYCPEVIMGVLTDDDVDHAAARIAREPAPSSLEDLTERLVGKSEETAGELSHEPDPSHGEATEGELPSLATLADELAQATMIGDVTKTQDKYNVLLPDDHIDVGIACDDRKAAIKAARGNKEA